MITITGSSVGDLIVGMVLGSILTLVVQWLKKLRYESYYPYVSRHNARNYRIQKFPIERSIKIPKRRIVSYSDIQKNRARRIARTTRNSQNLVKRQRGIRVVGYQYKKTSLFDWFLELFQKKDRW
jgi:hypothetical protein